MGEISASGDVGERAVAFETSGKDRLRGVCRHCVRILETMRTILERMLWKCTIVCSSIGMTLGFQQPTRVM
jgi:hypothetical protein